MLPMLASALNSPYIHQVLLLDCNNYRVDSPIDLDGTETRMQRPLMLPRQR